MLRKLLPLALLLLPSLAACGGGDSQRTVTLFAAASTAAVMGTEIAAFETAHPGIRVQGDYEGTQSLLTKLTADGAAADVLLSADARHMDTALQRGLVERPRVLARNRLVIAVPAGNPARIATIADLARPNLRLVLADPSVPAGAYAVQAMAAAHLGPAVQANVVSRESDVEQVVSKVAAGDADAGVVYATDGIANRRIDIVAIPDADQPDTQYPVAVTAQAHDRAAATAFVDFLFSAEGQRILRGAGFVTVQR